MDSPCTAKHELDDQGHHRGDSNQSISQHTSLESRSRVDQHQNHHWCVDCKQCCCLANLVFIEERLGTVVKPHPGERYREREPHCCVEEDGRGTQVCGIMAFPKA